jgi:hypothetical protein
LSQLTSIPKACPVIAAEGAPGPLGDPGCHDRSNSPGLRRSQPKVSE